MKKTIAVVGGGGFLGSNVAMRLVKNYEVTVIDNFDFGYRKNLPEIIPHDMILCNMDFAEFDGWRQFDCVVFMPCANIIYGMKEPVKTFETNSLKAIQFFDKYKGKIVYTSTSSIYGQALSFPTKEDAKPRLSNSYDTSKYIAECFLRQRGNYTTLRLTNTYGKNQRPDGLYCGVIGKLIHQAMNNHPFTTSNATATRDFVFVDDVVDAIELAVEKPSLETEINIGTGIETNILDLTGMIAHAVNNDVPIKYTEPRTIDALTRRCLDNTKAKELLGWTPKHTLKEGLKKTVEWMQKEYPIYV